MVYSFNHFHLNLCKNQELLLYRACTHSNMDLCSDRTRKLLAMNSKYICVEMDDLMWHYNWCVIFISVGLHKDPRSKSWDLGPKHPSMYTTYLSRLNNWTQAWRFGSLLGWSIWVRIDKIWQESGATLLSLHSCILWTCTPTQTRR